MKTFEITRPMVTKLLSTVDAGLVSGLGRRRPGEMCVEAAVCYSLGLPHGDNPPCVHPAIRQMKIKLNDANWSNKTARAAGMRRLAVLQLGTAENFDAVTFAKKLALATIKTVLPIALAAVGLQDHADKCAAVTTLPAADAAARAARAAADAAARAAGDAADVAARAAGDAADAAADAASRATRAAADAADAAAYAASRAVSSGDNVLLVFAKVAEDLLIEMKVPGVEYLDMIN